ncbi:MAG: protein phosphatase 2C domain-containing protein [Microcoleaceae cyanobacterium MO_207.B10]|nr:protein phosphatase 2C domain-containing protein [Microcoleaceae cyanobacterium MO_207.B10]
MPKHYLWAVGEGLKAYRPGEIIAARYQVQRGRIWLDTQPEQMPEMPEEIPGTIEPYLRLFPYRLHIPQVYGLASIIAKKGKKDIWLLERGPITPGGESLMPEIAVVWKEATPMRQLSWLWQIAQLWQPLNVQKVASSLINLENVRAEGPLVRLLELKADKKPVTLQQLGKLWQKRLSNTHPVIEKFFKQLCEQMVAGDVQNADQLIAQLDKALVASGRTYNRTIHITTATDTGPNRSHNEDSCYPPHQTITSNPPSSNKVAIVCDGIGGQDGGEEASGLAIKVLKQQLEYIPENGDHLTITNKLEDSICAANDAICDRNDNEERHGRHRMGTTLVMAMAYLHELYITHVGDSRAYWITLNGCYQVTLDDDVATRQVRLGYSLYLDAINQAASGALVQALGITSSATLHPTVQRFPINEDSIFLICSDGLSDKDRVEEYWETEILPVLQGKVDLAVARDRLIQIANTQNGHDNVTVALIHYQVTSRGSMTELSLPPIKVSPQLQAELKNQTKVTDQKTKITLPELEYGSGWFYLLGIIILLGLGAILAYFLSPLGSDLVALLGEDSSENNTVQQNVDIPPNPTVYPTLSLDVGSFILISEMKEPIELLVSNNSNIIKGVANNGIILKVTRKLYEQETTWLELEVCSTTPSENSESEFSTLLQPGDIGWIEQSKIESRLDIINLSKKPEKLDGCIVPKSN